MYWSGVGTAMMREPIKEAKQQILVSRSPSPIECTVVVAGITMQMAQESPVEMDTMLLVVTLVVVFVFHERFFNAILGSF